MIYILTCPRTTSYVHRFFVVGSICILLLLWLDYGQISNKPPHFEVQGLLEGGARCLLEASTYFNLSVK